MSSVERELTEHAVALRALARLLVGSGAADDLVQEVSLQALRSPPPSGAPMRLWLTAVLRHRASKLFRSDARRRAREQAHASIRGTQDLAAATVAAQRDAADRLHRALGALPQPYRDTLWLRFFQDQSPSAIAERTGTPLPTVKSRLQRGLELLRADLDRDERDRDWRPALAAAFGLDGTTSLTPVAAIAAGGLAMTISKITLAVGAAAALLWFAFRPDAGLSAPAVTAGAALPRSSAATGTAETEGPIAVTAERSVVAAPTAANTPSIRVRLVDAFDRAPLPRFAIQLLADGADADAAVTLTSDDRGELELPGEHRHVPVAIVAIDSDDGEPIERRHFATTDWPAAGQVLEVAFRAGPTYALQFVDETPPTDPLSARVAAAKEPMSGDATPFPALVRTGAMPWVRFHPRHAVPSELGTGPWLLRVTDEDRRWLAVGTVTTLHGTSREPIEMRVQACGTIVVRVTENGIPVARPEADWRTPTRYHVSIYRLGADGKPDGHNRFVSIPAKLDSARLDLLAAGRYRVFVGGRSQDRTHTAEVTVTASAETVVDADFPSPASKASVHVVARSQSGTRDLGAVVCVARQVGGNGLQTVPLVGKNGNASGTIADLADGEWDFSIERTPHLPPWNTTRQRARADVGTLEFVCLDEDAPPSTHVAIRVLDRDDRPIVSAGVTTFVDGQQHYGTSSDVDGNTIVGPYLAERPLQVLVRAGEHAPELVTITPTATPTEPHVVRLSPGWGTMFVVATPSPGSFSGEPLANVDVVLDGVSAGLTDNHGLLLVRAATPPRRIELRLTGYHYAYGALDNATGAPTGGEQSPYFCVMEPDR